MINNKQIYFKGLDGIRALAAIGVLIAHVFLEQKHFGLPATGSLPIGRYGVTIFFTLSGFLITYLLLQEKEGSQTVDIGSFYWRRILRIWPLYFLYLILCVIVYIFIFNQTVQHWQYLVLYLVFLPNIAFNLGRYPQSTNHLWSIGIEEQFYLAWPWVVKKQKNVLRFIYIVIFGMIFLRLGAILLSNYYFESKLLKSIFSSLKYDCLAIGALFAVALKNKTLNAIVDKYTVYFQVVFWSFYFLSFFVPVASPFSFLADDAIALITGFFILSQIRQEKGTQMLEWPVFKYLGKISFGIYIYHPLVIACFRFLNQTGCNYLFANTWCLTLFVLIFTILVAAFSYHFFEHYFLRLKRRFIEKTATN